MAQNSLPIQLKIDDSFFEEEIRNDYLISEEMKKMWAVELDLLNEFIKVCDAYGLEYHAIGGTLLGAIRHDGYIPWDDDIDVSMPRKDYEKLVSIAEKAFSDPYFFQTEYSDPGYSKAFAKLRNSKTTGIPINDVHCKLKYNQGIFIDIFPLDNLPDDPDERKQFNKELNKLNTKMRRFFRITYGNKEESTHKNPALLLFKITIGNCLKIFFDITHIKNPYLKKFEDLAVRYNNQDTKEWSIVCLYKLDRFTWERSDFSQTVSHPFEMLSVQVPRNYEKILKILYGDWHKLVKGGSVHQQTMFDTDTPYTQSRYR